MTQDTPKLDAIDPKALAKLMEEDMEIRAEVNRWLTVYLSSAWDAAREQLAKGPDAFESLDVRYHPPYVNRLWFKHRGFRVYLHRIEDMGDPNGSERARHRWMHGAPLYHPHPWPCAIQLLKGAYEHGSGTQECVAAISQIGIPADEKSLRGRLTFDPELGPKYAMLDPNAWHYVKPIGGPAWTLMIVGDLYGEDHEVRETRSQKAKGTQEPLSPAKKLRLWYEFCDLMRVTPGVTE